MRKLIQLLSFLILAVSCRSQTNDSFYADANRVITGLKALTQTENSRNYQQVEVLNAVAAYIFAELKVVCDTVTYQPFTVAGQTYYNVIGSMGIENTERIVIGAHYDVSGEQEGADDNASGVVGMLELARLLSKEKLKNRIDFVAYSLEEPPFFGTKQMGSYIHAKSLADSGISLKGMICLEMIGYFSNERKSQRYPLPFLKLFYGSRGNYITVVRKFGGGKFSKQIFKGMKKQNLIRTKSFKGPESFQGVDFSDHRNYWHFGYPAVMVTNTAFYRNPNYHKPSDRLETLNKEKMCRVIDEVYLTIRNEI